MLNGQPPDGRGLRCSRTHPKLKLQVHARPRACGSGEPRIEVHEHRTGEPAVLVDSVAGHVVRWYGELDNACGVVSDRARDEDRGVVGRLDVWWLRWVKRCAVQDRAVQRDRLELEARMSIFADV